MMHPLATPPGFPEPTQHHEVTGLLLYKKNLDTFGYGGPTYSSRLTVVPNQTPIYALKIRRLSSQYLPKFVMLLNQGNLVMPVRRIGDVHWFPEGYSGGVDIFLPAIEVSPTAYQFPIGSRLEIEVATTREASALMHDDTVDPWELAEGFTSADESVGGAATFPLIQFGASNNPSAVDQWAAKLLGLLISSSVSGIVTVTALSGAIAGPKTSIPKRVPFRTGTTGTPFPRFGILGGFTTGAAVAAPWMYRFQVTANLPVPLTMGHEMVSPHTPGGNDGDVVQITGPSGTATLEVTADWKEQTVDP